ncbi:MAG: hypothetical protein DWQ05_04755 [Calditrichaeota bacterium]|nr:MAG: hypothetical protein DWQ05_04755 [Calditrichota bacterium]
MNLWEKIKGSAEAIVGKTNEIVESSGSLLQKSADKIRKTQDESGNAIELSKLQAEVVELRTVIQNNFTALGGEVYVLYTTNKKEQIIDNIQSDIERLEELRDKLEEQEKILEVQSNIYEKQSISMHELKTLRHELDSAGGSIEHFTVSDDSPYIGLTLSEIDTPADILLGVIIRNEETIIPHGETNIIAGDKIMLMGKKEAVISMLHKFKPQVE